MSRGRGPIQLAVIAALIKRPRMDVRQIAKAVYKSKRIAAPTQSQINAVYTAVRSLARQEIIQRCAGPSYRGLPRWIFAGSIQKVPVTESRLEAVN